LFTKLFIAEQFHKTGVRFEAVAAVNIEVMLLWDLMAFSVADTNQYSRGRYLADYLVSLSSRLQSYSRTVFSCWSSRVKHHHHHRKWRNVAYFRCVFSVDTRLQTMMVKRTAAGFMKKVDVGLCVTA